MNAENEFLCFAHDFRNLPCTQEVSLWPRQGLIDELQLILRNIKSSRSCTPGTASKLFCDLQGFCNLGMFGRVGKAAILPFRQCQYSDVPPWSTSKTMDRAVYFYEALLS